MTNEDFYDREIATELLRLAKICQVRGMSVVASVEYAPGQAATTQYLAQGRSFAMSMIESAARAKGDPDVMIRGLMEHGRKHGHGSTCLRLLGVPHASDPSTAASEGDDVVGIGDQVGRDNGIGFIFKSTKT